MESGIRALEFGIQIQNSRSHYRLESRIQVPLTKDPADPYLGSEIRDLYPRIQDCLEFPYMGRTVTDYGCGRLKCANNNIMLLAGTTYTGERI